MPYEVVLRLRICAGEGWRQPCYRDPRRNLSQAEVFSKTTPLAHFILHGSWISNSARCRHAVRLIPATGQPLTGESCAKESHARLGESDSTGLPCPYPCSPVKPATLHVKSAKQWRKLRTNYVHLPIADATLLIGLQDPTSVLLNHWKCLQESSHLC